MKVDERTKGPPGHHAEGAAGSAAGVVEPSGGDWRNAILGLARLTPAPPAACCPGGASLSRSPLGHYA